MVRTRHPASKANWGEAVSYVVKRDMTNHYRKISPEETSLNNILEGWPAAVQAIITHTEIGVLRREAVVVSCRYFFHGNLPG